MSNRVKTLQEERARIWESMKALNDAAEGRAMTVEEAASWDKAEADISAVEADLRRAVEADRIEGIMSEEVRDRHLDEARAAGATSDQVDAEKRYADVFARYMRSGTDGMNVEDRALLAEKRAQSEGTNSAGGFFVPPGFRAVITETLKAYGGLMNETNQIHTSTGQTLPWPTNNDTGNIGALLGENVQVSEVDLTIGQNGPLNAWTYTSNLVLVSLQLLQDSAFDLDSWLPKKLGQRLGRAVAADLVTGSGVSRPTGLDLAPTAGKTGLVGQTTTVIYDDLVDLEHSVDSAYRQGGNCKYLMNDASLAVIRKLKDSQGHPLWSPTVGGFSGGAPGTILGYPYVVDQAMPSMVANAKSILFGDFEAGYITRWVLDPTFMRLSERYADFLQVGYFGFIRVDGRPDDTAAVRSYVNSAT